MNVARSVCVAFVVAAFASPAMAHPDNGTDVANTAPAAPEGESTGGRTFAIDNDVYTFEYSYPAAVEADPKLKKLLDVDLITRKGKLIVRVTVMPSCAGTALAIEPAQVFWLRVPRRGPDAVELETVPGKGYDRRARECMGVP